jgi:hypothetical protein
MWFQLRSPELADDFERLMTGHDPPRSVRQGLLEDALNDRALNQRPDRIERFDERDAS